MIFPENFSLKWRGFMLILALPLLFSACSDDDDDNSSSTRFLSDFKTPLSPDEVLLEYPRPQMVRDDWLNLNGLWEFMHVTENQPITFGQNLPRSILVPFAVESNLSEIRESAERVRYRRTFSIPQAWQNRSKILLHFGAVDWEATVFVNGQSVGTHQGGFDAFSFDITAALNATGEQELVVEVFDPTDNSAHAVGKQSKNPQGIFYTAVTGIWQTVWLEPVNATHIQSFTIVPDVDNAQVQVTVAGVDDSGTSQLQVVVRDNDNIISQTSGRLGETLQLAVPTTQLWSPDNPYLYDLQVTLQENEQNADVVNSYFGMRKVSLGKDDNGITRIMLNNEFVFQAGLLDQGYWPDGLYTAPTDAALRYDIEIAKELGFNLLRKHAKVEPQRWYYWCDKLGMLVWQDMPSANPDGFKQHQSRESNQQFELELKQMISNLRNHPAIIMWVVFNEEWGQYDTERLTQWVKNYDPSRLVNNASGWTDKNVGDVIDFHTYPDPNSPQPEENRAAVIGEFGGLGFKIENHTWSNEVWGYQDLHSFTEFQNRYQELFDKVWELKDNPGLSAVVYTQLTDVETEVNGLLTYDREIIKVGEVKIEER